MKEDEKAKKVSRINKANKNKILAIFGGLIVGVWLLVGAGMIGAWMVSSNMPARSERAEIDIKKDDGNSVITSEEADVSQIVKKVTPSVVSIIVGDSSNDDYYQGAGTGVIISQDGYILTNKHVVHGGKKFSVLNGEGDRFNDVRLVGTDPSNDIAFLKINGAKDLKAAQLGDSGTVRVGQRVIAIGNSLGQYQNTVTSGIISGKGRPIEAYVDETETNVETLNDLLQTDAAINPGNSGGPLLNMSGQVIGINTALVFEAQSMGFAIPINATKGLVRGVLKTGKINKPYMGVKYLEITPDIRAKYKLSIKDGALIRDGDKKGSVVPGGPADRAGLRDGDIIIEVNGRKVGENGSLGSIVSEYVPGEKLEMVVLRGGSKKQLVLRLGTYRSQR
ncbi:hypothetical protein CR969_01090 [Candidatus Saccharibacteria bacterium]|nr:MAG: hypothetical protein CR969_01090 [Candidatus Saccharibacteria bacterium]